MDPEEIEIDAIPDDEPLDVEIETVTAPTGPKASAEQQDAAWADSLSALDRARITARGLLPGASEPHRAQALMLLRRHVDTAMGQETRATPIVGRDERPTAGTTGLAQGATLGWADELGGAVRAQAGEGSYQQERDRLRTQARSAREQAPGMTALGEAAGTLPYMLIPGAGSTGAARIAVQGGIGAGLGTASGAGFSEGATAQDVAEDAAMGGLVGGALGAGGQTLAEGARAGLGQLARVASGADRARVASVATGTSRELGDTLMREAADMPGGISGVAERLRRLGVVPAAGTAQDVSQGAEQALGEVGYSGRLGQILDHLEQAAPVERERLLGALDRYAGSVEGDPVLRRFGAAVRRRAEDFAETLPDTIGYRRATEILRGIGDQTSWIDPQSGARPPQDIARGTYRALRSELDDVAEEALARSPEPSGGYRDAWQAPTGETVPTGGPVNPIEDFRGARLDTQAALFARDWSQRAMDRLARSRGISPTDYAAMMAGAGGDRSISGAVVGGLMNRTWRLREGALMATGAEMAERLVRQHPERLGRWAGPLMRALEQGGAAFAAAHMSLSARDPEYRRAVEQASEEATEEQE